ncbi:hypothetical protein MNBD_PLANCTO02-1438 [hydrothermal vent metagenome]|uniref:Uncharacterized protein n=1 Tax=hydrothermal vent metagenome TaxID=652676 RepID=A0A3B1E3K5_9ZZZZ
MALLLGVERVMAIGLFFAFDGKRITTSLAMYNLKNFTKNFPIALVKRTVPESSYVLSKEQ